MSQTFLFTGFPGFIATRIVKHISKTLDDARFIVLVHPSQVHRASQTIDEFPEDQRSAFTMLVGDITKPNLGLSPTEIDHLRENVDYVFHLAAIYDLAVPQDIAYAVNVTGTRNVTNLVATFEHLERYVYFSTAYVSGNRSGVIYETELAMGQSFKNHYESTKYEAELLVQENRGKIPTTIIRPGVVVGDSKSGETAKFDGPYFIMRVFDRIARLPIPYISQSYAKFNIVPVDYVVEAACFLGTSPVGQGKVYHLADPNPHTAHDAYRLICEALLEKSPSFTVPASIMAWAMSIKLIRQWLGAEQEALGYLRQQGIYDCTNAVQDLQTSSIRCPDFAAYVKPCVDFYKLHRHDAEKRILVR